MSKIYTSADQLSGNTPLLALKHMEKIYGLSANLIAKLEMFNPAGSAKDRIAKRMLDEAEKAGLLHEDTVLVEPTSGNTGIGLAAVAAARGYRLIIVMPDNMSVERRRIIRAYGAELVLTDAALGVGGAVAKAEELTRTIPHAFMPGQFDNPANPQAHWLTTGPEIWYGTDGQVDAFVAGIGTGGTITGAGGYLKSRKPSVRVAAVEPANSAVLSGGSAGDHALQGIGDGFIPAVLDTKVYDEVITVTDEEAFDACRQLSRREGILVGISSGAALHAGIVMARRAENAGKNIVVLMADTGERYLSAAPYAEE